MRTVTLKDLDAMMSAVTEMREVIGKLAKMCAGASALVAASGQMDGAIFGMQVASVSNAEHDRVLKNFEIAAANFLGEGCGPGESIAEFQTRVCSMSERELLATPLRNGLRLDLRAATRGGAR